MDTILIDAQGNLLNYSYTEIVINMSVALVIGILLSVVYRLTHTGLSYSQSFSQTVVFVSLIVAIVMMVIGGSLARAFALVGALSIIRFRTVLKDTKDMAYIFGALALGMACVHNQLRLLAQVFFDRGYIEIVLLQRNVRFYSI